MKVNSFKDLIVWQKSMALVKEVYISSSKLPRSELFSLTDQMRRAAVAIPSNIAEGAKRRSRKDYVQFLRIADGSAAELETQIMLAEDLYKNTNFSKAKDLLLEVQKMLTVLIKKLN